MRNYLASSKNKNSKQDMEFARSKIINLNGIDRVNSKEGYTEENSVPCCSTCNKAKLDMSFEDFRAWLSRAYHHLHE